METLDDMIKNSPNTREMKRALSVKMLQEGFSPEQISRVLNVSEQYVSKWKGLYEQKGVGGLHLGYRGKKPYLAVAQRAEVVSWIKGHQSLRLEELRDYVEQEYGVLYQSKQSYYDLLSEGGLSYHRSEAVNPKRDESQVLQKREELKKSWSSTNRT
jgi:putative transposase